MKICRYL